MSAEAAALQTFASSLVVEDDPQMRRLLTLALKAAGYEVAAVGTGEEAVTSSAQHHYDIIILDLGLPDLSGMAVLKQLREFTRAPVIILTVRGAEHDKIEALDNGADDYVTKPFYTGELLARMRAALRHAESNKPEEPVFSAGDLVVDFSSQRVTLQGELVKLTATEYSLLRFFIQHAGKVLTHRYILEKVWGPDRGEEVAYLRVYVKRLREKLEADPNTPKIFLTESGVGYRFNETTKVRNV